MSAGTIHKPSIADLVVHRELRLITNPGRYSSRAANKFVEDILPIFASDNSPLKK